MSEPIIRVENLSKCYRIGAREQGYKTFREAIIDGFKAPLRNFRRLRRLTKFDEDLRKSKSPDPLLQVQSSMRPSEDDLIWALKDVSFEVKEGEVLGIIGRNGAGKSTLLKILSRITEPTSGEVKLHGRVSSLLEVGTGFHPELTGRENIYLNGAILGMRKTEIERKFDGIVDFAEIEKFIDTPVKRYSSGMYVRLAFAVAAHLEPEILLVDEVLAVGDAAFQSKCLGKMGDVAEEGRTVLFVSHNMGAILGLCKRAMWLDRGGVLVDDEPKRIVAEYLESTRRELVGLAKAESPEFHDLLIEKVVLRNGIGESTTDFQFGSSLGVEIHFHARRRINRPYFWIAVVGQYGSIFSANMLLDGVRQDYVEGKGLITCQFGRLPLLPQTYSVRMGVRGEDGSTILVRTEDVAFFNVIGNAEKLGLHGDAANVLAGQSAPVMIAYEWHLPDGKVVPVKFG